MPIYYIYIVCKYAVVELRKLFLWDKGRIDMGGGGGCVEGVQEGWSNLHSLRSRQKWTSLLGHAVNIYGQACTNVEEKFLYF